MTLKDALDANRGVGPGFHLMRHALSAGIVLFHCRTAIYWSASAGAIATGSKAATAVGDPVQLSFDNMVRPLIVSLLATFFALSGFLVTGSAVRTSSIRVFFANRALRILPALSVEVTLSALILGPIFTNLALGDYFINHQFFRYFGNIFGFITFYLPGVFENLPWPGMVNGNLWTLPPEFWCYALMMVVMYFALLKHRQFLLIAVCSVLVVASIGNLLEPDLVPVRGSNFFLPWFIVFLFWVGATAFLYAERIVLRFSWFTAAALAYYLSILFNFMAPLAAIPLIYCMVYLGMTAFPLWDRLVKSDYSYGIYLYGFPIMQSLLALLLPFIGGWKHSSQLLALFPLTLIVTISFAAFSWRFIEKPALGLRKVFLKTDQLVGKQISL
jgi:peptidoglycan/LPS O-acetylase OafA/YrhL